MTCLTRMLAAAACACSVAALHAGQEPSAQKASNLVTVRGCLQGLVLATPEDVDMADRSRTFDLTANRELKKLLKEHNGHMEEVTGVVTGNTNGGDLVKEKQAGKNRIYVGAAKRTAPPNPASRPSIAVRAVTHLADRCSPAGSHHARRARGPGGDGQAVAPNGRPEGRPLRQWRRAPYAARRLFNSSGSMRSSSEASASRDPIVIGMAAKRRATTGGTSAIASPLRSASTIEAVIGSGLNGRRAATA